MGMLYHKAVELLLGYMLKAMFTLPKDTMRGNMLF